MPQHQEEDRRQGRRQQTPSDAPLRPFPTGAGQGTAQGAPDRPPSRRLTEQRLRGLPHSPQRPRGNPDDPPLERLRYPRQEQRPSQAPTAARSQGGQPRRGRGNRHGGPARMQGQGGAGLDYGRQRSHRAQGNPVDDGGLLDSVLRGQGPIDPPAWGPQTGRGRPPARRFDPYPAPTWPRGGPADLQARTRSAPPVLPTAAAARGTAPGPDRDHQHRPPRPEQRDRGVMEGAQDTTPPTAAAARGTAPGPDHGHQRRTPRPGGRGAPSRRPASRPGRVPLCRRGGTR